MAGTHSGRYDFLEHTADIQMRVRSESLRGLFTTAAHGLTELIYGDNIEQRPGESVEHERLTIEAIDQESLLVSWLSKILLLSLTRYRACVSVLIRKISATKIDADIGMQAAQALDDIKAVTYHNLEIKKGAEGFETVITFDV